MAIVHMVTRLLMQGKFTEAQLDRIYDQISAILYAADKG